MTGRASAPAWTGRDEATVQEHIDQVCGWLTVAHYHTKDSRGSRRGFLDSVCIGPGGLLVFEAKDDTGKTTDEQDLWIWLWRSLGARVVLVRPVDTQPRADLGGKTLIQVQIERIATGPNGEKFPPDIAAGIKKLFSRQARELAETIAKSQRRRR